MTIVTGNLPDDIATRKQIIGGLTRDAVVAQAEIDRDLDAVHSPTRIASAIVCRGRLDLVEDRKAPLNEPARAGGSNCQGQCALPG